MKEVLPQTASLLKQWVGNQHLPTLDLTLVGAYDTVQECLRGPENALSLLTYSNNVVRRLHMYIIYLLRLEFEASIIKTNDYLERFTQHIVVTCGYNQSEVSKNITRWSTAGSNLWALCSALGGHGVL